MFEQRLKIKGFGPRSNHKLYIGFLSQLTYFMQHSRSLPIKCIVLTLMGRIVENVGKRDMDAAFSAAEIVSNERILGAREFDIRTAALLCLAKMVEVLSDKFTPFISASLPKAIDELNSSISESGHDSGLHYAAYSFICTLLSRLPWMITSTHLKRLFEFSYKSASLNNGKGCKLIRSETLRLVGRNVEPHECFEALDQCWEYAMAEGPAVSHLLGISFFTKTSRTKVN